MFHLSAYYAASGGAASNLDLLALSDGVISQRNGHLILSEPYNMLDWSVAAAHLLDGRMFVPSFNAINPDGFRVFAPMISSVPPSNLIQTDNYENYPVPMPTLEEIQMQLSTSASEDCYGFILMASQSWNRNLDSGVPCSLAGSVSTSSSSVANPTYVANVWNGPFFLNFNTSIRSGIYVVNWLDVFSPGNSNLFLYRMIFPRNKLYYGRQLRPGFVSPQLIGNISYAGQVNRFHLGRWGAFHPFEPPMVELLPSTAGSTATSFSMQCTFIPGDDATLTAWIQSQS